MLELRDAMENAGGWGLERAFSKWCSKQWWRHALPELYEPLNSTSMDQFVSSMPSI